MRLALFAEMMKSRPWTLEALRDVGGTSGVGATFLDETFSAQGAPPEHRYCQTSARAVLRSLLPDSGTDIKGHSRTLNELLAASGYESRPRDFADPQRAMIRSASGLHVLTWGGGLVALLLIGLGID